jgi:hypothetical protein
MIKVIDLIICGREYGALEEELVFLTRLMNVRINGIKQTLNIVLREMHVLRQLNGFVWWTSICCHSLDLRREASTICALEPLGTTGKVCLKSPTKRMVIPPKSSTSSRGTLGGLRRSQIVLSTASGP